MNVALIYFCERDKRQYVLNQSNIFHDWMDFQYSRNKRQPIASSCCTELPLTERQQHLSSLPVLKTVNHISTKQSTKRNPAATAQPNSYAGSKFPQESVRQCYCSLGLGGTAEMGIDISLHSSNWNKTESSEKKQALGRVNDWGQIRRKRDFDH